MRTRVRRECAGVSELEFPSVDSGSCRRLIEGYPLVLVIQSPVLVRPRYSTTSTVELINTANICLSDPTWELLNGVSDQFFACFGRPLPPQNAFAILDTSAVPGVRCAEQSNPWPF